MKKQMEKYPTCINVFDIFKTKFGAGKIPSIVGTVWFGKNVLMINTCEPLQDIYINCNKANTKHKEGKDMWFKFNYRSLLWADTHDPEYPLKRKVVSGAFFKSKLVNMTRIIKMSVLTTINDLKA